MILFILDLKDAVRKKYPWFLLIGMMFVTFLFIKECYHRCNLDELMHMQRMAVFGFIGMSILSIDFFQELQKRNWRELMRTMQGGLRSFCCQRFLVLVGYVIVWFVFATLICIVYIWPVGQMPVDVRVCLLKALILNFVLFPMVGIVLGMFINVLFKKFTGYIIFLVFVTAFIGVVQKFNVRLYTSSNGVINLDTLARCFTLTQPNMEYGADALYLIPVEPYRFLLYIGWIGLFIGVFLLVLLLGKKRVVCTILIWCACAICFSQVINPGGISNYESNEGNGTELGSWHEFVNDPEEYQAICEITNDVTSYDLTVKIRKKLTATACMQVVPGRDTYLFTLYRGYELKSVTDQWGNPLEYTRDRDYITVSSTEELSEIVMEYQGHSGAFYSNRRTTVLPAGFAWYPQSGYRPVYLTIGAYNGYNTDMQGYEPVTFQLSVDGKYDFYSNLSRNNNIFEGKSTACTLIGGAFDECYQNDMRIIYPSRQNIPLEYLETFAKEFMNTVAVIEAYLQKDMVDEDALHTMIILPEGFKMTTISQTTFGAADHIVTDRLYSVTTAGMDYVRGMIQVYGRLGYLWDDMLRDAIGNQGGYRILSKESFFTEDEDLLLSFTFQFNMFKTLQSMGNETEVMHRILAYMQEDKYSVKWRDFMEQYYLELEEASQ